MTKIVVLNFATSTVDVYSVDQDYKGELDEWLQDVQELDLSNIQYMVCEANVNITFY